MDLVQGTLEMLVLRTLVFGPLHGYGIAKSIRSNSREALDIEFGSLYPALKRLEAKGWVSAKWDVSENNRQAKFYRLTATGRRQLQREHSKWVDFVSAVSQIMGPAGERGAAVSIFAKLRSLWPAHRRALEQDMREELDALAALAESEGARSQLGNLTRAAEEGRSIWTYASLEQFAADILYAARTMKQNPGFTAIALLSLALGIGANTAVFSLMDAILLKTLPVRDPESLVVLTSYSQNEKIGDFGYPDYLALRSGTSTLSGLMAASALSPVNAGIGGQSELVQAKIVSGDYFSVLGIQAAVGRILRAEDENRLLAVISYRWWKQRFGGSASAIGRQIDLDGKPFTIVGVAPAGFLGETVGESADLWTTIALIPASTRDAPGYTWLNLMGRLKPGVNARQASLNLSLLAPLMLNRFIQRVAVEPGSLGGPGLRNTFSFPLKALMTLVIVALLIACANLAGLLLARAASRQREIATRLAMGASRGRLFRQLMTESTFLALVGGLLGLSLAAWGQRVLLNLVAGVGRAISIDLRPDPHVLLFTVAASILTGLLFGIAPALHAIRGNAGEALKITSSHISGRSGRWGLRDALMAFQVALSMVLLVVGLLFIRTLHNLKAQDLGVRPANVLTVRLDVEHGLQPAWPLLTMELLHRLRAIPGVEAVTASFNPTLENEGGIVGFHFEGQPQTPEAQHAQANWVAPGYFATLGIPLLQGREFSPSDNANSQRVVVINHAAASRYFGKKRAVHRQFVFNSQPYEIVGVARDGKYNDLRASATPFVYFAALQNASPIQSLEIRTAASPLILAGAVRDVVRDIDPRLRIVEIGTLERRIEQKLAREILVADLAGFFAGLTLVLAIIGIYGTLAYSVARQTKEIGIRIALGAPLSVVARTVMGHLLLIGAIGVAIGIVAALAAGQLVSSLLFGLDPTDPMSIGSATAILSLATIAAGSLPVLRASRVEPTVALRLE